MKRILVATDLSARSERALRRAGILAQSTNGKLTVVHVVDDEQPNQIVDLEVREAEKFLRQQVESLPHLRDAICEPRVVTGDPFDAILRTAAASAADLIIMGSHRKQLLRDVFAGTTIERVIRTGPYPVLMVNSKAELDYGAVLAPVDMSDASANALRAADALGLFHGVRVTVAHAFLAIARGKMFIADASKERIAEYVAAEQRRLEEEVTAFLKANNFHDRGWTVHVREGAALEVIPPAVETMRPDLVVIGTHGKSLIARLFLGSVTEALLRSLDVDVLAVPRRRLPAPGAVAAR